MASNEYKLLFSLLSGIALKNKSDTIPSEKPSEKPIEKPIDKPIEKQIDKPSEKPIEKPIENTSNKSTCKYFDTPIIHENNEVFQLIQMSELIPRKRGRPFKNKTNKTNEII